MFNNIRFPQERTLYTNPTVTIYLDGLMVFCHYGNIFQAGIHARTTSDHVVKIRVRKRGEIDSVFDMGFTHKEIRDMRPFNLYVTDPHGEPLAPNADLYEKSNDSLRQAFANVLDFQARDFHGECLNLISGVLVPLNIKHGKFYSATLGKVSKKIAGTGDPLLPLGKRSTMVAADISNISGAIVMTYGNPEQPVFPRRPLDRSTQYEIKITNEPPDHRPLEAHHSSDAHECPDDPSPNHFIEYYKSFDNNSYSDKFIVCLDQDEQEAPVALPYPSAPPCLGGWCSKIQQLPPW